MAVFAPFTLNAATWWWKSTKRGMTIPCVVQATLHVVSLSDMVRKYANWLRKEDYWCQDASG